MRTLVDPLKFGQGELLRQGVRGNNRVQRLLLQALHGLCDDEAVVECEVDAVESVELQPSAHH